MFHAKWWRGHTICFGSSCANDLLREKLPLHVSRKASVRRDVNWRTIAMETKGCQRNLSEINLCAFYIEVVCDIFPDGTHRLLSLCFDWLRILSIEAINGKATHQNRMYPTAYWKLTKRQPMWSHIQLQNNLFRIHLLYISTVGYVEFINSLWFHWKECLFWLCAYWKLIMIKTNIIFEL